MDFITSLPRRYKYLMVVTDCLVGNLILCLLKSLEVGEIVGKCLKHVYAYCRIPSWIVSDRGLQWLDGFWCRLCKRLGVERKLLTLFHLQTDSATE